MELIRSQDYVIVYNNSNEITNEKIDIAFQAFYDAVRLEFENYPDRIFQLCNNIIQLYNERINSTDIQNYILTSKTLWIKLQTFKGERTLYNDILIDERYEYNINKLYEKNINKYENDTIYSLNYKKENLIVFFNNTVQIYTEILSRIASHKDNKKFHYVAYKNKIINKLNLILVEKDIVLVSFDRAIEIIKEKNHRRAVLKQCVKQNFGYPVLNSIEYSLIYKIDSYL